jgi:hypothetical protein
MPLIEGPRKRTVYPLPLIISDDRQLRLPFALHPRQSRHSLSKLD